MPAYIKKMIFLNDPYSSLWYSIMRLFNKFLINPLGKSKLFLDYFPMSQDNRIKQMKLNI